MTDRNQALYATNVYHYDHVLLAMRNALGQVDLVRRFELTEGQLHTMKRMRLPEVVLNPVSRRARKPSEISHRAYSLGMAQILLPSLVRTGLSIRPWHIRLITADYAKKTAKIARNYEYFHFSEGLGFKALASTSFRFSICERRNFHHNVYEQELDVYGGFPINAQLDPIGDILDFEYDNSDCILVYSKAARASFLERGFAPEKVRVVPIGIGPQLPRLSVRREPTKLLYVGRGDAYKGLDVAVATTKTLGRPFKLVVAGVMPPAVAKWLQEQSCVEYVGVLDRQGLRDAYSTSAAMILPSTESFGLAAAEAAYHGLPLLCSDTTGISEYLPESAKNVVSGREPSVWAAAAVELFERSRSTDSATVMKETETALNDLSWHAAAKRLECLYYDLLSHDPGGDPEEFHG